MIASSSLRPLVPTAPLRPRQTGTRRTKLAVRATAKDPLESAADSAKEFIFGKGPGSLQHIAGVVEGGLKDSQRAADTVAEQARLQLLQQATNAVSQQVPTDNKQRDSFASKTSAAVQNTAVEAQDTVKEAADNIKVGASQAVDAVQQGAEDTGDTIKHAASQVAGSVQESAGKGRDEVHKAADAAVEALDPNQGGDKMPAAQTAFQLRNAATVQSGSAKEVMQAGAGASGQRADTGSTAQRSITATETTKPPYSFSETTLDVQRANGELGSVDEREAAAASTRQVIVNGELPSQDSKHIDRPRQGSNDAATTLDARRAEGGLGSVDEGKAAAAETRQGIHVGELPSSSWDEATEADHEMVTGSYAPDDTVDFELPGDKTGDKTSGGNNQYASGADVSPPREEWVGSQGDADHPIPDSTTKRSEQAKTAQENDKLADIGPEDD